MLAVPAADGQVVHQAEEQHAIAVHRLGGGLGRTLHRKSLERPCRGIWVVLEQRVVPVTVANENEITDTAIENSF